MTTPLLLKVMVYSQTLPVVLLLQIVLTTPGAILVTILLSFTFQSKDEDVLTFLKRELLTWSLIVKLLVVREGCPLDLSSEELHCVEPVPDLGEAEGGLGGDGGQLLSGDPQGLHETSEASLKM